MLYGDYIDLDPVDRQPSHASGHVRARVKSRARRQAVLVLLKGVRPDDQRGQEAAPGVEGQGTGVSNGAIPCADSFTRPDLNARDESRRLSSTLTLAMPVLGNMIAGSLLLGALLLAPSLVAGILGVA